MRVAVGCFFTESNSFAAGATGLDQFEVTGLRAGSEIERDRLPPHGELASAWAVLAARGIEVMPALYAWAPPGPPLPATDFAVLRQMLLDNLAHEPDGVYLQLHGSALAVGVDDPEGELLTAVREIVGWRVPIAISLDCHANLSDAMARATSIVTAYRTVPHTDLGRTGRQAAEILAGVLEGRFEPTLGVVRVPMITPADLHDDAFPPFGSLMAAAAQAERDDDVLAAALLPVTPWLDLPDVGWRVAVTTSSGAERAREVAAGIAAQAWRDREMFFQGRRRPIDQALGEALQGPAPYVIADAGDATNGGSSGDSTALLRAAVAEPARRIFLTVVDPEAARSLDSAPVGVAVQMTLGHGEKGDYNEAVLVDGTVVSHPAGSFAYQHPFSSGQLGDLGLATVVAIGEVRVVVHERAVGLIDPSPYVAAGLDPTTAEVLQAKSHISYRAGFAPITERSVVADTPGPTAADLTLLPYRRRPVPLFPFERSGFGAAWADPGRSES